MPNPAMSISPSQLDTMDCRLKWHWQYRLGYRGLLRNEALTLGTGIHLGLEYYYGMKADPVAAFQAWAEDEIERTNPEWPDEIAKMQSIKMLGTAMLEGYLKHYKGKDDFDVVATEHTIHQPILHPVTGEPTPYHVTVRLDGIIRDHHTGRLESLEHKTYKRIEPSHFPRDHQFTMQVGAGQTLLETLGLDEEIIGVRYNGLRVQMPGPRVTAPLFERHFIERNAHQVKVALHRAYWQKHEFAQPGLQIYPQPSMIKCGRCEMSAPCEAYMRGEDYQQILDELFVRRDSGPRPKTREAEDRLATRLRTDSLMEDSSPVTKKSLRDRFR